ncbi:MAG: hypothetical protein IKD80_04720 [Selenomonadaceae bacterium]|nr:hypothetical protein [Selenomonadaceae bacterium]
MKIDLACVSLDTILLTKDYFEAEYGEPVTLRHIEGGVEVVCKDERGEQLFLDELHDFIKRKSVIKRTQAVKEIIIGRALYGLAERCH